SPSSIVRLRFSGADPGSRMEAALLQPGLSSYFTGSDSRRWHAGLRTYAQVRCRDLYPGIDLLYYGRQGELEYDLQVQPQADPRAVRLSFPGADRLSLNARGDLLVRTGGRELRQPRPVIYQEFGGRRVSVKGGYV